jgi:hypothetical protein
MSAVFRAVTGKAPPWEGCCDEHDLAYRDGGTDEQRAAADKALYDCVKARGYPGWALLMYLAVRFAGGTFFAGSNTWGYGRKDLDNGR